MLNHEKLYGLSLSTKLELMQAATRLLTALWSLARSNEQNKANVIAE
jgi:hypothetical protein